VAVEADVATSLAVVELLATEDVELADTCTALALLAIFAAELAALLGVLELEVLEFKVLVLEASIVPAVALESSTAVLEISVSVLEAYACSWSTPIIVTKVSVTSAIPATKDCLNCFCPLIILCFSVNFKITPPISLSTTLHNSYIETFLIIYQSL
jgi:hypothetical protein